MAHVLNIIYGSTTVNLTASGIDVLNWGMGGGEDDLVTEEIELRFTGSSASDLSSKIGSVQKAVVQARRYNQDRVGDRVFLSFQPNGYASAYTSEIIDAALIPFPEVLPSRLLRVNYVAKYRFVVTRRNYWQGAAVQLDIDNGNGTDNTSGLNVYNCNDGSGTAPNKRNNYFDVDGADVGGDLPAPVKITMTSALSFSPNSIWIGCNNYGKYSVYDDVGDQADSLASGGFYDRLAMGASFAAATMFFSPDDIWNAYGEQHLGILCRFNALPPSGTQAGLDQNIYDFYKFDNIYLSNSTPLQLLWVFKPFQSSLATNPFRLLARNASGGNLDTDYFTAIPINNYIRIFQDFGVDSSSWTIYDSSLMPILPTAYLEFATGKEYYFASYGPGIFLAPGKDHRLTLAWDNAGGSSIISQYFTVKLWYYPRRRTL